MTTSQPHVITQNEAVRLRDVFMDHSMPLPFNQYVTDAKRGMVVCDCEECQMFSRLVIVHAWRHIMTTEGDFQPTPDDDDGPEVTIIDVSELFRAFFGGTRVPSKGKSDGRG